MVAMRKAIVLLGMLAIAALSGGVAQAQFATGLVTCQATAVPPVVRAEGIAELVGDVVLVCQDASGGGGVTPNFVVNVSVSLNVNITNNIDFGAGTNVTDAVLVINENNCTAPVSVGSIFGGAGCATPDPRFQDPQFGVLAATNRLEWNEVTFPFPGVDSDGAGPGLELNPVITTLRVTSMRGNASQLGVPDAATFPSTQITAFVSITGPTTISITNNVLNVAVPIVGLITEIGDPITGLQCLDTEEHTAINLREGFATAFKTLGVATFFPGQTQWESGYYAPGSNNGAGASQATRFILRFFNIPEGVDVSVDKYINHATDAPGDGLELRLLNGTDSRGAGGTLSSGDGPQAVTISGGFGFAVYEVLDNDPFRIEECDVDIWFEWEADTENDSPAVGSGQVTASFAPLSTVVVASDSEPEPRFLDNTGDPETIVTVIRCTTTLLFPFVTNQAGFDTGMAISNTSEDWLGTDSQTGACTIHYHGATVGGGAAPSEQTSTPIAGGEQLIFTLSGGNLAQDIAGAPEFQGYVIAVCEFQYGHGFAFITDGFGGIPSIAQGYLALVIPVDRGGSRIAGVPGLHELGESLAH